MKDSKSEAKTDVKMKDHKTDFLKDIHITDEVRKSLPTKSEVERIFGLRQLKEFQRLRNGGK